MSSTIALPKSFEVIVQEWKDECRIYAKRSIAEFDHDPVPVILLACETGTKCIIVEPDACNSWLAKDIIFYEALPHIVAAEEAHAVGFFSANWHTKAPAHLKKGTPECQRYHEELEAFRLRHGSIEHHRDTKEGIGLIACDGVSLANYLAETRRHSHKMPTFGPWIGGLQPLAKQLGGKDGGGRIAEGMALSFGVDIEGAA